MIFFSFVWEKPAKESQGLTWWCSFSDGYKPVTVVVNIKGDYFLFGSVFT
jgi:hypothetical protein